MGKVGAFIESDYLFLHKLKGQNLNLLSVPKRDS